MAEPTAREPSSGKSPAIVATVVVVVLVVAVWWYVAWRSEPPPPPNVPLPYAGKNVRGES